MPIYNTCTAGTMSTHVTPRLNKSISSRSRCILSRKQEDRKTVPSIENTQEMNPTASVNRSCTRKFYQRRYHKSDQRVSTRKMGGGEAPENVKRANAVRYLEQGKMAKIKRKLRRKRLKNTRPRPPAPPPSSRGALTEQVHICLGSADSEVVLLELS